MVVLTSCGTPPGLDRPAPTPPVGRTGSAIPVPAPTSVLPGPLLPTTPPAGVGVVPVDCAGSPSGTGVIALLRRSPAVLPRGVRATVTRGPLCAGGWQYTVVQVARREPLQVVSSGPATDLTLVTAGTDVCNAEVRVAAPPGIRSAACDAGTAATATGSPLAAGW